MCDACYGTETVPLGITLLCHLLHVLPNVNVLFAASNSLQAVETELQQNLLVLDYTCQLTQVDLNNGHKL